MGVPGRRRLTTLYPWRRAPAPSRVRRAWVIPPISISENHKRLPYPLVQIKSDKQQLGSVIYSIQGPGVDEEPRGVFSIDKFTGKVFLNAMLDREKTDRFRLRAFALDLGGSTLEDPTDLEIVVVDQNDNRPAFLQEAFTGRVLEGAAPGTYVTRAEATDADDPETDNAALRFSILQQGSPELFSIDELTGEIRTVQVGLDREVRGRLTVWGEPTDGQTGAALARFFVEATEAVSGVDVGRLEVEDRDLPGSPNWVARFTILEGDPDGQFTIRTDPKTNEGVLSIVKALDYESCEHYELKVSVQNEAPLQAAALRAERGQAKVRVHVQDTNEPPVFQENPLRTSLAEGAPPGTLVATFSAQDPDTEQLQRLSYSKDYDPEDWLQVDAATGRIQTQRVLSPASPFLKGGWYRAIVLAQDDASQPRTATGTLSIEILEVNDHAPVLALPPPGSLCSLLLAGPSLPAKPPPLQPRPLLPNLAPSSPTRAPPCQTPRPPEVAPCAWPQPASPHSAVLVLLAALRARFRKQSRGKGLLHGPQDDLRDNVLNYDEQGGGEEDQDAYDISQLRHPTALSLPLGPPPLRRDAPQGRLHPQAARALPTSRLDIADFISDGLEAADSDPGVPPYDTALIYDYEGDGSVAGTLSSILSSQGDEDQDYDYLRDWGPRFARLADMYGHP
uniref:Cadherin domain-containing protein n=1 Tax=Nomascus leucogenys TaxID=61853 RepID=A0A2I3H3K5_NOMLE